MKYAHSGETLANRMLADIDETLLANLRDRLVTYPGHSGVCAVTLCALLAEVCVQVTHPSKKDALRSHELYADFTKLYILNAEVHYVS